MAGKAVARTPAKQSKPPAKTVEGKVVKGGPRTQKQEPINVTYNINSGNGGADTGGKRFDYSNNWVARTMRQPPKQVPVPNGVPRFLGNNKLLGYAWVASMILIAFDEWHNNGILPRPVRLWSSSVVFGILALVSMLDFLIPIVNALAIGYLIMLLWQYFNGSGQFTATTGEAEGSGGKL